MNPYFGVRYNIKITFKIALDRAKIDGICGLFIPSKTTDGIGVKLVKRKKTERIFKTEKLSIANPLLPSQNDKNANPKR